MDGKDRIEIESMIEMLEHSYDGIWITDGKGKILFANVANAELVGAKKEDLQGKSTQELLQNRVFSDSAILQAIHDKKQVSKATYNYRTKKNVLATATPILDKNGTVKYVYNNVRDITALNQLQKSLAGREAIIRRQNQQLENMKMRLGMSNIIASSKAFHEVVELAQRVAEFELATVLILGESGTGKELVAEMVVKNSPRKDKPFVRVNCGAIPENLIESELFGYEKGAFTGANEQHIGLFESANGGTIFLDEIGELPLNMQVKLLRVLQQKELKRVGANTPIKLNVRIIAATNRDLEQMVYDGQFRDDLYYRLNVVTIFIPPLRERKEDIMPLVNHFLHTINEKYGTEKAVFSDTVDVFEAYPWPGNVRELENMLESLVITSPGPMIRRENLPTKLLNSLAAAQTEVQRCQMPLKKAISRTERRMIQDAMKKYGSIRKAAAALEVDPSTIVRKLQCYRAADQNDEE